MIVRALAIRRHTNTPQKKVTSGMSAFFGSLALPGEKPFPEEWHSPYTNVLLYNMKLLRSDARLQDVFKSVG